MDDRNDRTGPRQPFETDLGRTDAHHPNRARDPHAASGRDAVPPPRRYDAGVEPVEPVPGERPAPSHDPADRVPTAHRPAAPAHAAHDVEADRDRRRDLETRTRVDQRNHVVLRAVQVVDYLFYLLYALLGIRFVLTLLGASESAGFAQFINGLTQPFYGPFSGIVARPALNGGFLDFPLVIALLAYMVLHFAVRGLLRLLMASETGAARQ